MHWVDLFPSWENGLNKLLNLLLPNDHSDVHDDMVDPKSSSSSFFFPPESIIYGFSVFRDKIDKDAFFSRIQAFSDFITCMVLSDELVVDLHGKEDQVDIEIKDLIKNYNLSHIVKRKPCPRMSEEKYSTSYSDFVRISDELKRENLELKNIDLIFGDFKKNFQKDLFTAYLNKYRVELLDYFSIFIKYYSSVSDDETRMIIELLNSAKDDDYLDMIFCNSA